MHTIEDCIRAVCRIAPEETVYPHDHDNVGLMLGNRASPVSRMLCCLDVSEEVAEEAVEKKAGLILSHHPLIFYPVSRITADTPLGRTILKLARNEIAVYSAHTNLDFAEKGINQYFAQQIGLTSIVYLEAYETNPYGMGRVGNIGPVSLAALRGRVEELLSDDTVRIVGRPDQMLSRVAVINGGAGGDTAAVDKCMQAGAQCLITADIKHHVAVYAKACGICLIEPSHYSSEHFFMHRLKNLVEEALQHEGIEVEVLVAERESSPKQ